tara:strand:+ start:3652 stop:4767 length:1116 start_codon:yes stop_codon:yes gene_type:complete
MSEEIKENEAGELSQGEFKIKKKPKKFNNKIEISKIDLSKNKEDKVEEVEKVEEKENKVEETPAVEEKDEVSISEIKKEKIEESEEPAVKNEPIKEEKVYELPSEFKKLVDFMSETGGTLKDYVRLNTDYSEMNENAILKEYYKSTKPHLNNEEIDFIMEDNFSFDKDVDEERDIRKKKLAFKEEIAKARNFLEETKAKYYEEIKLKPSVSQEQQKAMDFFNRYNKEQDVRKDKLNKFENESKEYFAKDFKGFEFSLGKKTFRYDIKNVDKLAEDQSKLQGLVGKFLSGEEEIDHKGYHKALYAAENVDDIANHFYEQGKADAIKEMVSKSKNVETASRPQNNEELFINGFKVKAISGVDSSKLKIKSRKK